MFWKNDVTYSKILDFNDFALFSNNYNTYLRYFKENPVINGIISLISNSFSDSILDVSTIIFQLLITGNCFVLKNKLFSDGTSSNRASLDEASLDGTSLDGTSLGYEIIPLDNIKILSNKRGDIVGYKLLDSQETFDKKDVIHLKLNNFQLIGISPLQPLQLMIETHNKLVKFLYQFIENNGRPAGIISYKGNISASQKQRMQYEFNSVGNQGGLKVMDGEFYWQQIGLSVNDMKILEIKENLEIAMCNSFGVPPILFGIRDPKFQNFESAMTYFEKYTLKNYRNILIKNLGKNCFSGVQNEN